MAQCNSRYVTRYFASYVEGTKLWIVMEYVGGGSILDIMDNGPVSAASSTHAATRPPAPYQHARQRHIPSPAHRKTPVVGRVHSSRSCASHRTQFALTRIQSNSRLQRMPLPRMRADDGGGDSEHHA